MALYLCVFEQSLPQAERLGYRPGQDVLVLAHDAAYAAEPPGQAKISAPDLVARGLPTSGDTIDDRELLRLIMQHDRVVIL